MNCISTKHVAAAAALALITLVAACEHSKFWRGAEPWPDSFVRDMADPVKERAELSRRMRPGPVKGRSPEQVAAASAGCMSCHGATDEPDMHADADRGIGCADCHGGDPSVMSPLAAPGRPGTPGTPIEDSEYLRAMLGAHVPPRNPAAWYGSPTVRYGDHVVGDPTQLHGSRNPEQTGALLLQESPEFVRFINPGDLRVADITCGACHADQVAKVRHSMMTHGAQLWGAALYNNGAVPNKAPSYGESYSAFGLPQRLQGVVESAQWNADEGRLETSVRPPTAEELSSAPGNGVALGLDPLPVWNIAQPGNILRIFERGTRLPVPGGAVGNPNPAEIGNPNPLAEGGRPDKGLSPRGLGTANRTDPVFLGLQKTRLLDPTLPMLGTNDHAGDYRSSGCTACHTLYANDRNPRHSGEMASLGNRGLSHSDDPTLPKDESGHPIRHVFTNAIPSSQCIVCHVHPGTSYANQYLGYMWWDNESDGEYMYPATPQALGSADRWKSLRKNPDDAAARGLWGDLRPGAASHAGEKAPERFLDESSALNPRLKHNQFADFHGHGWMFRAVHKKDRTGNLLDADGAVIDPGDPEKWNKAVHLADVHMSGPEPMHCVDCHFTQDVHGDGHLYGEVRNAIEITCVDCHGSYDRKTNLITSGPAARPNTNSPTGRGRLLSDSFVRPGTPRFEWEGDTLYQRSALNPDVRWEVVQTADTIDPASAWAAAHPEAARKSRYAKTVQKERSEDGALRWGDLPAVDDATKAAKFHLAHGQESMECYTCHSSWMTSCFGCHLPMQANERAPMLHNENLYTRNYTRYNFQVLRDDVFMLGRDSAVKGGKIVPVRSSSAVIVSSQNANREWIYHQQQTISAEGYNGQAFNPHFPHSTSGQGTTRTCTDCHVSRDNDNNAWLAQLTLQGTNFVNFLGRYVYVATGGEGLEAVAVTEHDEPQAVYGSRLHELAYPDRYDRFVTVEHRELKESYHHDAQGALDWLSGAQILDVQVRGEYLYAARGKAGFYAFDVANIDNKGFSERIVTAPVSPAGQRLGFDTKNCVAIASPSTLAIDPARTRMSSDPQAPRATILEPLAPDHVNLEQAIHPMYAYLYIGDAEEGLILTSAATLLDGNPTNNFLERATLQDGATAFNPDGLLTGLTGLTLAGHYLYATSNAGLVIVSVEQPLAPSVVSVVGTGALVNPRAVAVQFRYAFVTDAEGLKVIDVTRPERAAVVPGALVPLRDARRLYLARTYAFVAAGADGLAIVDITRPEAPQLLEQFTADGAMNDTNDVKVGMTNASLFAYVADGRNGLRVLRLMGPDSTAQFRGFSPPLQPELIATRHTHGPALALSKGLDRDRAVDETGHQIAVFGRLGARPFNQAEMRSLFLGPRGLVWTVTDEPETEPLPFTAAPAPEPAEEPPARRPRPRR